MTKELTYEQETVRSVFGAYINDLKAYSSKPDRPTFRKLEEVRDKAIKALEQQPSEDCVSRDSLNDAISELTYWHFEDGQLVVGGGGIKFETVYKVDDVVRIPNILPSVKPKYTDEEIDRAQAVEQAYVDKMVELAVEETKRPKGKWVKVDPLGTGIEAYMCSECKTGDWSVTVEEYKFCPYCGAEMEVEE